MLKIKAIEREEEAVAAVKRQNSALRMPEFLFHDRRYQGVVWILLETEQQIGLAFGVAVREESCFYLHHFSIDTKKPDSRQIYWFLEEICIWLREQWQISRMNARIPQKEPGRPLMLQFLERTPFCKVEKVTYIRQLGIRTCDFAYLRQYHWYCPQLLEQKGYEAVPWENYDKEQIRRIRQAELSGQTDGDYLSPGIWETDWAYDGTTSFVLVKKGEITPLGWIVTERTGNARAVRLRRFYIYNAHRKKGLGPAFSTWVLDVIAKQYEYMYFEVVKGNRQMEMFTEHYCRPILDSDYYHCSIMAQLLSSAREEPIKYGA